MGVGDEDMTDFFALHRLQQGVEMRSVVGAWIDDRDLARAHDEARRATKGERAGIAAEHAADEWGDLLRDADRRVECAVEGQAHGAALYAKGGQR